MDVVLRYCAMALVVVAVVAAGADAAPPRSATIRAVSDWGGHLRVEWDLPPNMVVMTVEVATQPFTDWGGFFWAQNVVAVARMHPAYVRYQTPERLDPGTYWVHVQTFDPECAGGPGDYENVSCIAWSTAVSGRVERSANRPPELNFIRWASRKPATAGMRVCDDTFPGPLAFRTTLSVNRFADGNATRRRTQRDATGPALSDGVFGCRTYNVALPAVNDVGRYTMKMTVSDSRGSRSNTVVKRWSTRD